MVRLQNRQKFANYGVELVQSSVLWSVSCRKFRSFKIRSEIFSFRTMENVGSTKPFSLQLQFKLVGLLGEK